MSGWIKIYRKIQDSDMYKQLNSKQRDVMVQCLLLANHKEITWEWQGDFITCHPGQFITSLQNLKKVCAKDVSIQNIRTALGKLKKWQFLTIKSTKTGRLVTVLNWVSYQQDDIDNQQSNQQRANKELTTNKNVKNDKKKKKNNKKKKLPTKEEAKKYFTEYTTKYHKENNPAKYKIDNDKLQLKFTEFWEYWQEREWAGVKNWKLRAGTWVRKMFSNNPNCLKPYKQQKRDSRFVEFKF
jgi:hypothetical protein